MNLSAIAGTDPLNSTPHSGLCGKWHHFGFGTITFPPVKALKLYELLQVIALEQTSNSEILQAAAIGIDTISPGPWILAPCFDSEIWGQLLLRVQYHYKRDLGGLQGGAVSNTTLTTLDMCSAS